MPFPLNYQITKCNKASSLLKNILPEIQFPIVKYTLTKVCYFRYIVYVAGQHPDKSDILVYNEYQLFRHYQTLKFIN